MSDFVRIVRDDGWIIVNLNHITHLEVVDGKTGNVAWSIPETVAAKLTTEEYNQVFNAVFARSKVQ